MRSTPFAPRSVLRGSLMLRYAAGDLARNRAATAALFAVLVLSAFLMATGAMVVERMVGAVDRLFDEAKPPHFLQMHVGEVDAGALQDFAARHPEIESWTVAQLYGFDGAAVAWQRPSTGEGGDLADSLIDNLFVAQNSDFDFLIDETGAVAEPRPGEVYVPVAYRERFELQAGDELRVRTDDGIRALVVRGAVRDAQMASSLSSATRFVVAPDDLRELGAGGGAPEVIVEYRLTDPAGASALQAAYEADPRLPKNGQAVTGEMIRLVHTFSDGLIAVALVFASLLLIAISMLSLRFVIRGSLQDEVREIGGLKAIGIPDAHISRLYRAKYAVMTLVACIVGGLLAVWATAWLTKDAATHYAVAAATPWTLAVPVAALALVYVLVMASCRAVLRGVRRVEVVNALVHGSLRTERQEARLARRRAKRVRRGGLAGYRGGSVGSRLALLELRAEWRQWMLLPIVFFLAAILITLPMNLLTTFESPRFVTYLGAPQSDLRADLQFSENSDGDRAALVAAMAGDERISGVRVFARVLTEVEGADGAETLRTEVGEHSAEAIDFVRGGPPERGEIALSVLNAGKHGVGVGDALRLRDGDGWTQHTVSGVYQDVTGGGYTAKLPGEVTEGAAGYVVYADLADGVSADEVAAAYGERFPAAAVIPMGEYVQQTLAHVTGAARSAAALALAFGVGIALLITSLFLGLRLARDRRRMGVLSAIGFSVRELTGQVLGTTMLLVVAGTLAGLVVTATLGDALVGSLIAATGTGLAELTLIPVPWAAYGLVPLLLIAAGWLGAVLLTARLRRHDRSAWLA